MGQKLQDDKIGTLSHNTGVISLTASRLTIGGQQYTTTATITRTISTDVTLAAVTLYMIYAVLNAGTVELRISSNVNSVGPAGFTSWKLVGAFYSDGLSSPAFGSFVNIEGPPESDQFAWLPIVSNLGAGSGSVSGFAKRYGDTAELQISFAKDATPGSGASVVSFSLPGSLTLDNAKVAQASGNAYFGGAYTYNTEGASQIWPTTLLPLGTTALQIWNPGTPSSYKGSDIVANSQIGTTVKLPISGWSSKQLKDL